MTEIIVEALEKTGQRGIINKGWGGLGNCKLFSFSIQLVLMQNIPVYLIYYLNLLTISSVEEPKEFIYLLDNCPHDWLFFHCMAVVRSL